MTLSFPRRRESIFAYFLDSATELAEWDDKGLYLFAVKAILCYESEFAQDNATAEAIAKLAV
jgi:hypothetical protein